MLVQVETLSQQAQAVTRERQKLEAEAARRKSHQSTMTKAVKNLTKKARGVVERIHETEMGEYNMSPYHTETIQWSILASTALYSTDYSANYLS